jgi:hypothetical protein
LAGYAPGVESAEKGETPTQRRRDAEISAEKAYNGKK